MSFPSSSFDDAISEGNFNDEMFTTTDYNSANNANLLRDIESLIQNMERKQTRDNDSTMLNNIDNILSNIKLNETRPLSPQSNLSAEPIRTKSPISRQLPSRNDDRILIDVQNIFDNIRDFVSNNIQDIVPDLVSQVEQELTSDLNNEVKEITVENLDEFLRSLQGDEKNEKEVGEKLNKEEMKITERNASPYNSNLEEFLRNRHDEEFDERNASPSFNHHSTETQMSNYESANEDLDEFLRNRHDEEYHEANDEFQNNNVADASHDSITVVVDESEQENDGSNLIVDASELIEESVESNANSLTELVDQDVSNQATAMDYSTNDVKQNEQLEPLKYKSSFNLKILKQQTTRRTRSEREFKKRNSLILENVLLGRKQQPTSSKKNRPKSLILNNEPVVGPEKKNENSRPPTTIVNEPESNINHGASLINENIESEPVLNEINASGGSETNVEIKVDAEDTETRINGIVMVDADEPNESLLLSENAFTPNEDIGLGTTTITRAAIESIVDVIINDGNEVSPEIINDDAAYSGVELLNEFRDEVIQSVTPSSSENDPTRAPQNLSELVEDTQRLIKQMKDEINAIYVSDDDYSSSRSAEYSDEWIEGFDEEEEDELDDEYTDDEGSEYEEWSGEYIESDAIETTPEDALDLFDDANINVVGEDDNNELLDNLTIGNDPTVVNETENVEAESVVHGKLELTPMSSNHFKVENDFGSGALNNDDDDFNLNISLNEQEANERPDTPTPPSTTNPIGMNNELAASASSIKEIVNEAINDVISAISFDETENVVSLGNDNHHSQITDGSSFQFEESAEHDSTTLDSAMNNLTAEVTIKVSVANNDSITSGITLNDVDVASGRETIFTSIEPASNAEREEDAETLNDDKKSDQLKNDVNTVGEALALENPLITEVENVVGEQQEALRTQTNESVKRVDEYVEQPHTSTSEAWKFSNVLSDEAFDTTAEVLEAQSQETVVNLTTVLESQSKQADYTNLTKAPSTQKALNTINSITTPSNNNRVNAEEFENQSKAISIETPSAFSLVDATNAKQLSEIQSFRADDVNQAQKGAVAKSKIPSKVKSVKNKISTLRDSDKTSSEDSEKSDEKNKSKSSSPDKIKALVKKEEIDESTNHQKATRKSSFDNSLRKKSVPTPFGMLASSNVKSLQSQFLNKSTPASSTPTKTQPTKLKPSKLVPPKALSKEPASTFANKLTKLITPPSNAKSNSEKFNHAENSKEQQRDHSKDVVPEKKYMEHCFSDEYPTTTDDEDEEQVKEVKAKKSFNIKKPPPTDSDDETSDVRKV